MPDDARLIGPCPPDVPYEEWIARGVAQAPPLLPEVIERLARLLPPVPLDA